MPLGPGTEIGAWRVEAPLGEGTFAVVWSCRHRHDGRRAAAKILKPDATAEARERLRRESEVLARMDHAAIPHAFGIEEIDGQLVVLIEEVSGTRCDVVLKGAAPGDPGVREVALQLCEGLAHAHAHGIAHRDIKPEHVLVDGRGQVRLLDFGAAKDDRATRLTLTRVDHPMTPLYAPPEWFRDGLEDPKSADAYAVGQVIYELATGSRAFRPSALEALGAHKIGTMALTLPEGHPADLREVVQGLTAADARARWPLRRAAAVLEGGGRTRGAADGTVAFGEDAGTAPAPEPTTQRTGHWGSSMAAQTVAFEPDEDDVPEHPPAPTLALPEPKRSEPKMVLGAPPRHWSFDLKTDGGNTWAGHDLDQTDASLPSIDQDIDESQTGWGASLSDGGPPIERVGRYLVVRELGRGGNGVVFEAQDPELDRRVAVKLLPAGRFARSAQVQRFLVEARAVARLDHPDIVPVLDLGRTEHGPFFTMAFVDGPTLADQLNAGDLPTVEDAIRYAATVARALHHAHELGIVHRDVKPGNIMLEGGERPKLVDFGLALGVDENDSGITREGQIIGTPRYIAPEQARGQREQLGPTVDVYSLAVVLYQMLSGAVPFDGRTPLDIIRKVIDGRHTPLGARVPTLPASVSLVCEKAMSLDAGRRYDTALAFAEDLERCLTGEPVQAVAPSLGRQVRWWVARHRVALGAAGFAGVSILALVLAGRALQDQLDRRQVLHREADAAAALKVAQERAGAVGGEEGDAIMAAFLDSPEYRNTDVVHGVMAQKATALAMGGDEDAARRAWATVLLSSSSQRRRGDALIGLARLADQRNDLLGLDAALRELEELAPERMSEVDGLRRHLEIALRTWTPPPAAPGDGLALERALASVTDTGKRGRRHVRADLDDDGRAEVYLRHGSSLEAVDGSRTWELGYDCHHTVVVTAPSGPDLLFCVSRAPSRLLQPVGSEMVLLGEWQASVRGSTTVDLDGDGVEEIWVVGGRTVYRLDVGGDTPVLEPQDDPRLAANSEVNDIGHADLDGDGTVELFLNPSEWAAYDVRVLGWGDDGLELRARTKVGVTTDLQPVETPDGTLLAVNHPLRYPSRLVFPPGQEYGLPEGVFLMRYADGELRLGDEIRPGSWGRFHELVVADLDGDGTQEVVTQSDGGLEIHRKTDGRWSGIAIAELALLTAEDADGDGDDELLVYDRGAGDQVWWLGMGDDPMPKAGVEFPVKQAPPVGLSEAGQVAWGRAEALGALGLFSPARDELVEAALMVDAPPLLSSHYLRAARFAELDGDAVEAARLYARAWEQVVPNSGEIKAAATQLAEAGHRDLEIALLDAAFGADLDEEVALEVNVRRGALAILEREPEIRTTFDAPLDPAWRVPTPWGVRRDPTRGQLQLAALAPTPLLARPVRWEGGPLVLELSVDELALEWGTDLEVGVRSGDRAWGVELRGKGGGGIVFQDVAVSLGGQDGMRLAPDPSALPWTVRSEFWLGDDLAVITVTDANGTVSRKTRALEPDEVPTAAERAGDFELDLRVTGHPNGMARARLGHLELRGALPTGEPPEPTAASRLVEGDTAGAADLARTTEERLQVLLAEGRDDEVMRLLRGLPTDAPVLYHLVHDQPAKWIPRLELLLGDAVVPVVDAAMGNLLGSYGGPDEDALLVDQMSRLTTIAPPPGSDEERLVLDLLAARTRAALRLGRPTLARTTLDRIDALVDEREALQRTEAYADANLYRARLALATQGVDAAAEAVRRGLAHAPSPTVFADRVDAEVALAVLEEHPVWAEVRAVLVGH